MLHNTLRNCLLLAGVLLAVARADALTLHVAVDGADDAPGTSEKPLATVQKAVALVNASGQASEIIVHGGRYFASINLDNPVTAPAPPLTIRAADGETPIFDGSQVLDAARPLPGAPGVYAFDGDFAPFTPPQVWDEERRARYVLAADETAVRALPDTVALLEPKVAVMHTSDSQPPSGHVRRSLQRNGIFSQRDNLTLRGLRFENDLVWQYSAGVAIQGGQNVTVEDCSASNCVRGFLVGSKARDVRFERCKTSDVGEGLYSNGENVTVKNGVFLKTRDSFQIPIDSQDDAGIECYSPGTGMTARGNFVQGFVNGIFIKASPGDYLVENNTLIGEPGGVNGTFNNTWKAGNIYRRNIIVGFDNALTIPAGLKNGGAFNDNLVWSESKKATVEANLAEIAATGNASGNVFADPRFAAPENGDFRLLRDSPALKLGADNQPAGAFGVVPAGYVNPNPPTLQLTPQAPAKASGEYGKLFSDRDESLGGGRTFVRDLSEGDGRTFLTPRREVQVALDARHSTSAITRAKVQVDKSAAVESTFTPTLTVQLPDKDGPHHLQIWVQTGSGLWSAPQSLSFILVRSAPRVISTPRLVNTEHGAVIMFDTDRPAIASAEVLAPGDVALAAPPLAPSSTKTVRRYDPNVGLQEVEEWVVPKMRHTIVLALPAAAAGQEYGYRVTVGDAVGNQSKPLQGRFTATGPARVLHVAPDAADDGDGTVQKPMCSIQAALDEALPGDTVLLAPGLYGGSVDFQRGGVENAPITLEAAQPNTVILDGRRDYDDIIHLENAPYVTVRNLNVRWFRKNGISLFQSPHARIESCRFINDSWAGGFTNGIGIAARQSPFGVFDHNIGARLEVGIYLLFSPHANVINNTTAGLMFGGLELIESSNNSVVKNNCFCYSGNDSIAVYETDPAAFASLALDYNNYGNNIRNVPNPLPLPFPYLPPGGKAVVGGYFDPTKDYKRFQTLKEWQQFSGKDQHTIFADPQWIDPASNCWDVKKTSPNLGAGENGADIGALGYLP